MPSSRGIFSTQGSNPSLPHCRQILYHLSHQGCPCRPTRVTTIQTSVVIVLHVYEFHVNKIIHTIIFFFFWLLCVFRLRGPFASCREWELLSSCGARASNCSGFLCRTARSLGQAGFSGCGSWALEEHGLNSCGARA